MSDLKRLNKIVHAIMEDNPETRNNDHILYKEVLNVFSFETGSDILSMTLGYFLRNLNIYGCPKFESVSRCRRKIQELHPELKAADPVEAARMENEKEFRAFALGVTE